MCGILGYLNADERTWLHAQVGTLRHRGPDDEGVFADRDAGVGLGHRRLSVIDLSPMGHQPMVSDDGQRVLTFNGEIYNFQELRSSLEAKGHRFRSNCDTEVLLHLYAEYGTDCLEKLRGMFAFALWDNCNKTLFMARDPLGIKPLYVRRVATAVFFSSEIRPLLSVPGTRVSANRAALDDYLAFLYVPSPQTMFEGIERIRPGYAHLFSSTGEKAWRYWDVEFGSQSEDMSLDRATESVLGSLTESINYHLRSDVPVGLYLSGGLDSSLIAALAARELGQRLRAFTLQIGSQDRRYDSGPDDMYYAAEVAKELGLEHDVIPVEPDIERDFLKVVQCVEEPIADPSAVASYLLCERAHRAGMKVLLSGIGGDEVFAGYPRHIAGNLSRHYRNLPRALRRLLIEPAIGVLPGGAPGRIGVLSRRLKALRLSGGLPFAEGYLGYSSYGFPESLRRSIYQNAASFPAAPNPVHCGFLERHPEADELHRMLYLDLMTFQPDQNLNHLDRTSMAHSIEVRVPYVDRVFVNDMMRIPSRHKLRGYNTKYVLKKAGERLLSPRLIWRRKSIFTIPTRPWLRGVLRPLVDDALSERRIRERGVFDPAAVRRIRAEFDSGKEDHHLKIWTLLTLELWSQSFLDKAPASGAAAL